MLAFLADGESWSSSALALALGPASAPCSGHSTSLRQQQGAVVRARAGRRWTTRPCPVSTPCYSPVRRATTSKSSVARPCHREVADSLADHEPGSKHETICSRSSP